MGIPGRESCQWLAEIDKERKQAWKKLYPATGKRIGS